MSISPFFFSHFVQDSFGKSW